MKSRSLWKGLAAGAGMLVLIFDAQTALDGMQAGSELCLKTLIPALFPFFVLSVYLTGNLAGLRFSALRPIGRLCGIPEGAESLLLTGFLGGYPVGAQNIALARERGALSKEDAERMLGFCSNAGPAFLFGVIGRAFESARIPWLLWGIHMTSALIVGAIIRRPQCTRARLDSASVTLTASLRRSITAMAQVCGWVVLFRMLLAYLDKWFLWLAAPDMQIILSGILELSNGCVRLRSLEPEGLRLMAASAMLALGGLCVTLQTCSVTAGLSLRYYFPGKLLQTALSILMSAAAQLCLSESDRCRLSPAFLSCTVLAAVLLSLFLRKNEKNSSIPASVGV